MDTFRGRYGNPVKKTIVFRIDEDQKRKLDELAARASETPSARGGYVVKYTTSDIVREAIHVGLAALEKKYPAKPRAKKKATS